MKKSLFLTVLVAIATYCYTQVDTISTNIYQNNGFLGIGTTNPSTSLEIIDNVNNGDGRYLIKLSNHSLGAYSTCGLKLMAGSGDEFGAINFTSETYNDPNQVDAANSMLLGTNAKSIGLQVNQPDGYIKFSTGGLSKCYPAFERMRIDGSGNIGIGTSQPNYLLHLEKNVDDGPDRTFIHLKNPSVSDHSLVVMTLAAGNSITGTYNSSFADFSTSYTVMSDLTGCGQLYNAQYGLALTVNPSNGGAIKFLTNDGTGNIIEHLRMASNGKIGIGIKEPIEKLDINGGLRIGNTENTNSGSIRWTGSDFEGYNGENWLSFTSGLGERYWNASGSNISYTSGNVGIGTSTPDVKLRIEGNVDNGSERALLRLKNLSTSNHSSVSVGLESNNSVYGLALTLTSEQYTGISDFDKMGVISVNGKGFSIYSTSDYGSLRFYTNMDQKGIIERMRITADGEIGIGTKEPVEKLDINGGLRIGFTENANQGSIRWTGSDFEGYNGGNWLSFTSGSGENYWNANGSNIFYSSGYIGIGTSSPSAKLQIADGDIYISDIEKGIIMKSPDGQCWRGTLDNTGSLIFVSIQCPEEPVAIEVDGNNDNSGIMQVFPNPSGNSVSILIKGDDTKKVLKIYSTAGVLISSKALDYNLSEIDISNYQSGIFLFNIEDNAGNFISSVKVIKR